MLLDFSPGQAADSTQFMRELNALLPNAAVIAVGGTSDEGASGVLAAMRAGVRDFIDLDALHLDDAEAAIRHVMEHHHADPSTRDAAAGAAGVTRGRIVLLLGVRAGVGTSTLAAHLGVMLQQRRASAGSLADKHDDNHVLALDLGEPAGDIALYLDVHGDFQINDAIDNAWRLDATLVRTALTRHASNLAVLPRSDDTAMPSDGDRDFGLLLDRLGGLFDLVLVDGGGMSTQTLPTTLINQVDEIWLVADQGIASMVSLDRKLKTLRQCGADPAGIHLVMNRYEPDSGLSAQQIAERFKVPLLATLPERGIRLRACANAGKLLHETAPRDRYVQALKPLLNRLAPGMAPASEPGASWWRRLRKHLRA